MLSTPLSVAFWKAMPTQSPFVEKTGPPEFPGLMAAAHQCHVSLISAEGKLQGSCKHSQGDIYM